MSFLSELKQRKVVRTGIAYAVAGFVALQAADLILNGLGAPPIILKIVIAVVLLGFPLALGLAWAFDVTPAGVQRTEPASGSAARGVGLVVVGMIISFVAFAAYGGLKSEDNSKGRIESIAVLPFDDLSPAKDQEYFGDGVAEQILDALSKLPDLRVAARPSSFAFKGQQKNVRAIAAELEVGAVLSGSIRKDGDRVRITAQLTNARTGYQLWSDSYDRQLTDIFAVQDEIATEIVAALNLELGGTEKKQLVRRYTDNLPAYELYLKGRHEQHRFTTGEQGPLRALEHYRAALALDSTYALAWAAIAETYSWRLADNYWPPVQAYPKAREAAQRALALDPNLGEAHTALGQVLFWHDWDIPAAEKELRTAIALNPKDPSAWNILGRLSMATGNYENALEYSNKSKALDPTRTDNFILPAARIRARPADTDRYIDSLRAVVRQDSTLPSLMLLRAALYETRRVSELTPLIDRFPVGDATWPQLMIFYAEFLALIGRRAEAEQKLAEIRRLEATQYIPPDGIAVILAALGRKEEALAELQRALQVRSGYLTDGTLDSPGFDSIRRDPRFVAILRQVGLTDYFTRRE